MIITYQFNLFIIATIYLETVCPSVNILLIISNTVNIMGSHQVRILYLASCFVLILYWRDDGCIKPKHVATSLGIVIYDNCVYDWSIVLKCSLSSTDIGRVSMTEQYVRYASLGAILQPLLPQYDLVILTSHLSMDVQRAMLAARKHKHS
jgi:hypothetical protein